MQNAITTLRIQNFKSIKDVTMAPRRVNIIIGEPNVGKSNILEALSLLGGMVYDKRKEDFMSDFIRYQEPQQIFYQNLIPNSIRIETDKDIVLFGRKLFTNLLVCLSLSKSSYEVLESSGDFKQKDLNMYGDASSIFLSIFYEQILRGSDERRNNIQFMLGETPVDITGKLVGFTDYIFNALSNSGSVVRFYSFKKQDYYYSNGTTGFLEPPYGNNLPDVIRKFNTIQKEVSTLFKSTKQKLFMRSDIAVSWLVSPFWLYYSLTIKYL